MTEIYCMPYVLGNYDPEGELPIASYEADMRRILEEIVEKIVTENENKKSEKRILVFADYLKSTYPEIEFAKVTSKQIKIVMKPSRLCPGEVHPSIEYTLTFLKRSYGWKVARMNKLCLPMITGIQKIIESHSRAITTRFVFEVLIPEAFNIFLDVCKDMRNQLRKKVEEYNKGEDVWFHELEEVLVFPTEELNARREKKNEILKRMQRDQSTVYGAQNFSP